MFRVVIPVEDVQRIRYYKTYDNYLANPTPWDPHGPLPAANIINRFTDYRDTLASDCKIMLEYNKIIVYALTMTDCIDAVHRIQPTESVQYYQVSAPKELGTIEFTRKQEYKFRNYFKSKRITLEDCELLRNFIKDQQSLGAKIRLNDAMTRWLSRSAIRRAHYLSDAYYIDYCDERMEMIFSLTFGEHLKPKIFKLVQRTSTV